MKRILLHLLLLATISVNAQQDLTLYYMNNVPQRLYLNPAFKPAARLNIGLPVISSIYLDHMNTVFTPKNLFESNGVNTTLTIDDFKKKIRDNNYLGISMKVDLLSIGFTVKKNYFSFNATENVFLRANLSRGFLELPLYGNADFEHHNGTIDMKNLGVNFSHYREFGFGWQREMNDKLSLGAKLKFLSGKSNVWTKTNTFKLETNPDNYDWTVSGQLDVRTSGFDTASPINNDDPTGYLRNNANKGFAVDFGGVYKLNEKITLNGSIVDLGIIRWKSDNFNVKTNDASFDFRGLDLTEIIYSPDSVFGDSIDEAVKRLRTSAENELGYSEDRNAYTNMLLTRIHLGGTYQLYEGKNSGGKAGVLVQTEIYQRRLRPSLTLSYNQSVGRWLNASVAYSMINRGYNNLGLGLSANLGPVQLYTVTDNIFAARLTGFQDNGETQFAYPTNSKKTHVHVGINITIGRERKDSDGDGISDNKDKCPDVFGVKEFKGCPDTDGDGVEDSKDECPTVSGTINGCPDRDEDGIIDSKDKCPDDKGIEEFEGCPDTDSDGIQDSEDACPTVAGLKEFNGCPDTDGDKISDKEDACPNEAGPKENKGCPWGDRDKDGSLDNADDCPDIAGPKENKGCPYLDTDKDGILDKDDACPTVPGVKENKGCPKLEKKEVEILKKAFDNLEFETGKDIIKASSYASLNELAGLMSKKEEWNLKISGHTDNVGNDKSNMQLSQKRALAVKKYLAEKGIKKERLITLWFGETQPISSNKTKEGRQKNRRVEMEIVF